MKARCEECDSTQISFEFEHQRLTRKVVRAFCECQSCGNQFERAPYCLGCGGDTLYLTDGDVVRCRHCGMVHTPTSTPTVTLEELAETGMLILNGRVYKIVAWE